ncbi:MAG: ribosomal protein L7/L12 [Hyphomicrobiaceae bacterium]|nr:ribosomal protein L7/L12 [Hyphomicrobiaceae bacterium]
MPEIPQWLQVGLLVVWAFFLGRWSVNRGRAGNGGGVVHAPRMEGRGAAGDDASAGAGSRTRLSPATDRAVRDLVRQQRVIEAIKLVRQETGLGLKESKDLVDRMRASRG